MIKGERKREHEEKEEGNYKCERLYGMFHRAIPLPEGVNTEKAKATFKNGVLEVTMPAPKPPEKQGRRIEVKAAQRPEFAADFDIPSIPAPRHARGWEPLRDPLNLPPAGRFELLDDDLNVACDRVRVGRIVSCVL